jgi:hypothetical protein
MAFSLDRAGMNCSESCNHDTFYPEALVRDYSRREYILSRVSFIPIIGPLLINAHDGYFSYEIKKEPDLNGQIILRKMAIRILERSHLSCVIQSIVFSVLYGVLTYMNTRSLHAAYLCSSFKICGFYSLMSTPTFAMISYHKWVLNQEREKREIIERNAASHQIPEENSEISQQPTLPHIP